MKLIDKDALVAEIESKIEKYTKRGEESDAKRDGYGMYWGGVLSCLNEVRTLCDTLEVKKVDLEKEFDKYTKDILACDVQFEPFTHLYNCAKHFFELGLKAQSNITLSNIDDVIRENGSDPDSKEAKVFKEAYFVAIDKAFEKFKKENKL